MPVIRWSIAVYSSSGGDDNDDDDDSDNHHHHLNDDREPRVDASISSHSCRTNDQIPTRLETLVKVYGDCRPAEIQSESEFDRPREAIGLMCRWVAEEWDRDAVDCQLKTWHSTTTHRACVVMCLSVGRHNATLPSKCDASAKPNCSESLSDFDGMCPCRPSWELLVADNNLRN